MNALNGNFVELHRDGKHENATGEGITISFVTDPSQVDQVTTWIDHLSIGERTGREALALFARATRLFYESIVEWLGLVPVDHVIFAGHPPVKGLIVLPVMHGDDVLATKARERVISLLYGITCEMVERGILDAKKAGKVVALPMERISSIMKENASYALSRVENVIDRSGRGNDPASSF